MIIGHARIIQYLSKAASANNLAHAYIFSGPESIGKMTLAMELAKFLQCPNSTYENLIFNYCDQCKDCYDIDKKSHPDVLMVEASREDISISQIRDLIKTFGLKNYSAPYKIALIDKAERMTNEASNALLKTLEEPTKNSILILVTSYQDALLGTITSRCQQIKFSGVAYQDLEKGLLQYHSASPGALINIPEAARLASGRPGIAIKIIKDIKFKEKREEISSQFLWLTETSLSDRYQYVNSLISANPDGMDEILSNWLYVLKDAVYLRLGKSSFVLNIKLQQEIQKLLDKYSLNKIVTLLDKVKETKFFLRATNVNKKLALEVLMLEF